MKWMRRIFAIVSTIFVLYGTDELLMKAGISLYLHFRIDPTIIVYGRLATLIAIVTGYMIVLRELLNGYGKGKVFVDIETRGIETFSPGEYFMRKTR